MFDSFAAPWTIAFQVPLSMRFPRQGYWSGLPFPALGDLPPKGSNLCLLHRQVDFFITGLPEKPMTNNISYAITAAAAAKSLQSCSTLCNPIDGSPPGSPTPGVLQARILEWVAISFSNAWKWKVKVKSLSHVWLLATPRTTVYQAPLSMGFFRQAYWSAITSVHQFSHELKS